MPTRPLAPSKEQSGRSYKKQSTLQSQVGRSGASQAYPMESGDSVRSPQERASSPTFAKLKFLVAFFILVVAVVCGVLIYAVTNAKNNQNRPSFRILWIIGWPINTENGAPMAVSSSPNNIYVADTENHIIQALNNSGHVKTIAGIRGTTGHQDGSTLTSTFNYPTGLCHDLTAQAIYVVDSKNHLIRRISEDTGDVTTLAGSTAGYMDGQGLVAKFNTPFGITLDTLNNIYISDTLNKKVRMINSTGYVSTLWENVDIPRPILFDKPMGICFDAVKMRLLIVDQYSIKSVTLDPINRVRSLESVQDAVSIAVDAKGNYIVTIPAKNAISLTHIDTTQMQYSTEPNAELGGVYGVSSIANVTEYSFIITSMTNNSIGILSIV